MGSILIAILILGGATLIALGFRPFTENFQTHFGRSSFHFINILCIAAIVLTAACMSGSAVWTIVFYIACAAFIGIGIWQMFRYGFLWGLGVWFYNILTVILVVTLIHGIAELFGGKRKR
jgi:hypothetical protein